MEADGRRLGAVSWAALGKGPPTGPERANVLLGAAQQAGGRPGPGLLDRAQRTVLAPLSPRPSLRQSPEDPSRSGWTRDLAQSPWACRLTWGEPLVSDLNLWLPAAPASLRCGWDSRLRPPSLSPGAALRVRPSEHRHVPMPVPGPRGNREKRGPPGGAQGAGGLSARAGRDPRARVWGLELGEDGALGPGARPPAGLPWARAVGGRRPGAPLTPRGHSLLGCEVCRCPQVCRPLLGKVKRQGRGRHVYPRGPQTRRAARRPGGWRADPAADVQTWRAVCRPLGWKRPGARVRAVREPECCSARSAGLGSDSPAGLSGQGGSGGWSHQLHR